MIDGAQNALTRHDRQVIGAARLLAGDHAAVVVVGDAVDGIAAAGGDRTIVVAGTGYRPETMAATIARAIAIHAPRHVVFPETADGGDLARRRIVVSLPAMVTVHQAAPPPLNFVHSARRAGRVHEIPGAVSDHPTALEVEPAPYRQRPKLIIEAPEAAPTGRLMLNLTPEAAAAALLAYIERFRPRET